MRFGSLLLFSFLFLNLRFVLHPHWGEEYIRVGEYEYSDNQRSPISRYR